MKHIFKVTKQGTLDLGAFEKIKDNLFRQIKLLGVNTNNKKTKKIIIDTILYWTKQVDKYNHTPHKSVYAVTSLLNILNKAHRSLNLAKNEYLKYTEFNRITADLNDTIELLKIHKVIVTGYNKLNRKSVIKNSAISKVFANGEALGISADTKQYAGRGNLNKLFKFVQLITGISSRNTLNRRYKQYIEMKNAQL